MTRILGASPIGLLIFVIALTLAAYAVRRGLVPDDVMSLWAGAISAGDGNVPLGRIVASYPTLPFLATAFLEIITPSGTPTPALLAVGLLALLAGIWFRAFRSAGLPSAAAIITTLLITLHPAMLVACSAAAAEMVLVLFLYWLGVALFDLRARTAAPEVMAVSLALLGLAFSHPMGAAVAFAVTPVLIFAVRPTLIANSALFLAIALVFPMLFALGAFAYVSWIFPGSGWSFLAAPVESLAMWSAHAPNLGHGPSGLLPFAAALLIGAALLLGGPLIPAAIVWVRNRGPLIAPPLVFVAGIVIAAALTVATGLFGTPASLVAAAPVLAAVLLARVPAIRERLPIAIGLLAAGWLGGAVVVTMIDPRIVTQLSTAQTSRVTDTARLDALALGGEIRGREGILIDTDNAPIVVVGRGRAQGLIAPSDATFALTLMFARLDAPFVAVPDPNSTAGTQDRINRTFPRLYRDGAPGYRLTYQNRTWRLYARLDKSRS